MKRVALCMRGAISKESGAFQNKEDLYREAKFVDYVACYHSIVRHLMEANPEWKVDIFCQSWNVELKKEILDLYQPVKSCFEDNRYYNDEIIKKCVEDYDFGGISQALAFQKSIELKNEYSKEMNCTYDLVILYRYDVLLWKDMVFEDYQDLSDTIYVNAHPGGNGDFHFAMNDETSTLFMYLYDSIEYGNPHIGHFWIQNYVVKYIKKKLKLDSILPGVHQECMRKIKEFSIDRGHLSIEQFHSYR